MSENENYNKNTLTMAVQKYPSTKQKVMCQYRTAERTRTSIIRLLLVSIRTNIIKRDRRLAYISLYSFCDGDFADSHV